MSRADEIRAQQRAGRSREVNNSDDINLLIHDALEAQLAPWTAHHIKTGTDEERRDALRQLDHSIKISGIRRVILDVLLSVENLHAPDCDPTSSTGGFCACGALPWVRALQARRMKLGLATNAEIRGLRDDGELQQRKKHLLERLDRYNSPQYGPEVASVVQTTNQALRDVEAEIAKRERLTF